MYLRKIDGRNYLCIYKYGVGKEQEYNNKNEIIDNQQVLICGSAGSGKSVFLDLFSNELWQHGYTTIFITEKPSREFDNAFFIFNPEEKYHLDILKSQKEEPISLGDCVIRYHPLVFPDKYDKYHSFNYHKSMPPMKFFSFDIRKIDEFGWSAIYSGEEDKEVVSLSIDVSKKLKDNEGMWHFISNCISDYKNKKISKKASDLFAPLQQSIDERHLKKLRQSLKVFRDNYIIQPHNFLYNINFVEMLNNNKQIHLLSTKWINNERVKFFVLINFLTQITKALETGLVHNPICLVIEEARILLPKTATVSYQDDLSNLLRKLLSIIRANGYVLISTQNFSDTNKKIRSSCSAVFLGKLSKEDSNTIPRDYSFDENERDLLYSLRMGQFVLWEQTDPDIEVNISDKLKVFMPRFAHPEEKVKGKSVDFFDFYKKYYSHLMKDHKSDLDYITRHRDELEKFFAKRLDETIKKSEDKKPKGKVKQKDTIKELESKIKIDKEKQREELMKKAYETKKRDMKLSWRTIAKGLNKDHKLIKKYAVSYAEKIDDMEFVMAVV